MLLYLANSKESFRLGDLLDVNKFNKTFEEILVLDKGEPLVSIGAWCLMTNHFHILVRQEVDGGITKFSIYNIQSVSLYSDETYVKAGYYTKAIDVSSLRSGLYILKIENNKGSYYMKFIIQ